MSESVGVIIGRFQVPELHAGHRALIDAVRWNHTRVIILLGNGIVCDTHDPIPCGLRSDMLFKSYPMVRTHLLPDQPTDAQWSAEIDRILAQRFEEGTTFILYGGRDNCLRHYTGAHFKETLNIDMGVSGTEARQTIVPQNTPDFRAGICYAHSTLFPTSFQCVDMAVIKKDQILVGRKASDPEGTARFPGGFVDPRDPSLERAASRELREEVGMIEVAPWGYAGSLRVDDWRYRSSPHKICTALFVSQFVFGAVLASDDLAWCGFIPLSDLPSRVHPSHQPLLPLLTTFLLEHPHVAR